MLLFYIFWCKFYKFHIIFSLLGDESPFLNFLVLIYLDYLNIFHDAFWAALCYRCL